jgi:hypothetical protein
VLRGSFVLGILGCIFGLLAGTAAIMVSGIGQAVQSVGGNILNSSIATLYVGSAVAIIGSIMAIAGGVAGRRRGGAIMIIGSILILVGTSLFGLIGFTLTLVGGILAWREKPSAIPSPQTTPATTS